MEMKRLNTLKKSGFYFLLLAVVSDFLTPYVLGIFYPELNQTKAVISLIGEVGSPVRQAFLVWSVVAGFFYVLSLPAIYQTAKDTSSLLAVLLTSTIGVYGIGDCIFTGLFSVDTQEASWGLSTWIHNVGSGIGYAGFLFFPFFLALIYQRQEKWKATRFYLFLFIVSLLFACIYGLARIPVINQLPLLSLLGFWQRVSFFFNYLPILVFAVFQNKRKCSE